MGYDTIELRQFIKLDEKRFIPMVRTYSSNCTQIHYGRNGSQYHRKTRSSYSLHMGNNIVITMDEVVKHFDKLVLERYKSYCEDGLVTLDKFKANLGWYITFYYKSNRFLSQQQIINFYANGLKEAIHIDELYSKFQITLRVEYIIKGTEDKRGYKYVKNEEELLNLINNEDVIYCYLTENEMERLDKERKNKLRIARLSKPKPKPLTEYFTLSYNGESLETKGSSLRTGFVPTKYKTLKIAENRVNRIFYRFDIDRITIKKHNLNTVEVVKVMEK